MFADIDAQGWAMIFTSLGGLLTGMIGAIFSGIAAVYAARAKWAAAEAKEEATAAKDEATAAKDQAAAVKDSVQKIETATNGMKDALVQATKVAGLAEGEKVGRAAQKAETRQDVSDAKES